MGAVIGAALLLFPAKLVVRMTDRHSARVAEIEAGAPEAYFEELRELKAYPPPKKPMTLRVLGGVLLVVSAGLIVINLS